MSSTKCSGDNTSNRPCLLISILGICVLNLGDCINENMLLSLFFEKKLKIFLWMKYVAVSFAVRDTVHSYEITLVHLICILLVGQKIRDLSSAGLPVFGICIALDLLHY